VTRLGSDARRKLIMTRSTRKRARSLRRRRFGTAQAFATTLVWLVAAALVLPSAAPASVDQGTRAGATLSARLTKLASLQLESAADREVARALSLPLDGAGSLLRSRDRVLVDVRFRRRAGSRVAALTAAGAKIVHVSRRYQTVTVWVAPKALHTVARLDGVASVTEQLAPMVAVSGDAATELATSVKTCQGSTTSEGDVQLGALEARREFDIDGRGVKVSVLSDSFDRDAGAATRASQDVASGDLPGPGNPCKRRRPVEVLDDSAGGSDEGRAILQVIHDLAPGATLSFGTAFKGELAFADSIRALRAAGAAVIVDDIFYFDEPFFQDGPVGVAIGDVTAAGAAYFTAGGNDNIVIDGRDVASFEAPAFRPSGACPSGLPSYVADCMDFDAGEAVDTTYGIRVAPGRTVSVDLQWAQPWNGVTTDFDAYLLSSTNDVLAYSEYSNVTATQKPFEFLSWTNNSGDVQDVHLAVNSYTGPGGGDTGAPRLKLVLLRSGLAGVAPTEYTTSTNGDVVGPTIFGHFGSATAVTLAAVPFANSSIVEPYSSRGPTTHYYGPVTSVDPAPAIIPQTIDKPDLSATDCGVTTFFGLLDGTDWRFCGTSAAAPHAAAVAALQYDERPSASFAQIRAAQTDTAVSVGPFGPNAAGAGLLDALAAVRRITKVGG